ncbi:MAG: lipopolysaccharide biosynthesis protein [Acidimicrobiales bacterium]|nr:lipopolysaccharide biosynthesis protein [Acidimicrobiales bacterium]
MTTATPTPEDRAEPDELEVAGADDPRSLQKKVVDGLRWGFAQQFLARAVSFGSGVALARILVPEDFGTFAVALAVTNILFGLNDLGLLLAVVRWKGDIERGAETAFTLATIMSVGLYAICFLGAPWYAAMMGSPEATWILRLLLFTVVLDGACTAHHGLLIRAFRQDRIAQAEFWSMPLAVGCTIGLALLGWGAWSFAIGQVAANVVTSFLIIWWAPFRPRPGYDRAVARKMLAFGLPLAGASLIEYVLLNADYMIIGRTLGPIALGFYLLAYNLSNWPSSLLTEAIRKVSFVSFHELSDEPARLAAAFRRSFVLLVTLSIPLVLGLMILTRPLIEIVYGPDWSRSAKVLQFLAILGGARVCIALMFDLLVGVGRSAAALRLKIAWCVALVPALELGVRQDGIRGVAIAHAVVVMVIALPLFLAAVSRLQIDLRGIAGDLLRPAAGGALAATATLLVVSPMPSPILQLLVGGTVLVVAYAATQRPMAVIAQLRARRAEAAAGQPSTPDPSSVDPTPVEAPA